MYSDNALSISDNAMSLTTGVQMANVLTSAEIFSVTILQDAYNQRCMNVLHYVVTEVVGAPLAEFDVFNELDQQWRGAGALFDLISECWPDEVTSTQRLYQTVWPVRKVGVYIGADIQGQIASNPETANVAATITKKGDLARRNNLGSIHLIGPSTETVAAEGRWGAPHLTRLNAVGTAMIAPKTFTIGAIDYSIAPIIYHVGDPGNPTPLTAFDSQETVRVMRRRTVNVGK